MVTVAVDAKGRLSIPANVRDELGVAAGDVLFLATDAGHAAIHLAKAQNPFDALVEHAIEEYRQGRTTSIEDFARERGIDLDDE
jgi:AbrB family looped-hinge helix DNA binding protein